MTPDSSPTAPAARPAPEPTNEARLRRLLAFAYAGSRLYADDGELQDSRTHPLIDFRRDSVDDIERCMRERAAHADARRAEADATDLIAEFKRLFKACDGSWPRLESALRSSPPLQRAAAANARVRELEDAIQWACGANGEFPTREDGQGAYWWRRELYSRAAMPPTTPEQS